MRVAEITEKSAWESFFNDVQEKTFLQSWNWGEFQKKMGNKIWRLGLYEGGSTLLNLVLAVRVQAKRGTFLLVQHNVAMSEPISDALKEIAKKEGCSFVRMAPLLARTEENKNLFKSLGFKESPMHANAYEATWKLDITISEEELLRGMRKTTRYLIRQAEKNPDIKVEKSVSLEDLSAYQKLNQEVAQRQRFVPFSDDYLKNEFEIFAKDNEILLLSGRYKGEVAAAAMVVFWQGIGFYHQAASLAQFVKFSVPYLLQWEAIKEAKRRGCGLYDFWGYVDPKSHHPWAGPTLFKMGFGGQAYEYVKTQDLPLSKSYWLTYAFEILRKIKRGL